MKRKITPSSAWLLGIQTDNELPGVWFSLPNALLYTQESCDQNSAEEVAQGLSEGVQRVWARVIGDLCVRVYVSFIQWNATPLFSSVWCLRKQVWLYLKAWPGRETQTTVWSNISSAVGCRLLWVLLLSEARMCSWRQRTPTDLHFCPHSWWKEISVFTKWCI